MLTEKGLYIGLCELAANAARIVSCVNACVGMEDPAREIERLKAERDRLLNVIRVLNDDLDLPRLKEILNQMQP